MHRSGISRHGYHASMGREDNWRRGGREDFSGAQANIPDGAGRIIMHRSGTSRHGHHTSMGRQHSWRRGGRGDFSGAQENIPDDAVVFTCKHKNEILKAVRDEQSSSEGEISKQEKFEASLKVVGGYSEDSDRKFSHDRSVLSFFDLRYMPDGDSLKVSLNLTEAEDGTIVYDGTRRIAFCNLLQWIMSNISQMQSSDAEADEEEDEDFKDCQSVIIKTPLRLNVDFVGPKHTLTTVCATPYCYSKQWVMYASCINGTVYFMSANTDAELERDVKMTSVSNWAHKFEQIMTGGNPKLGVVCNQDYRAVLKATLGPYSFLYSAAVDCADPSQYDEDHDDLSAFISLKCAREITSRSEMEIFQRFKLFLWKLECVLTGIPRVVAGFRNDDGFVHELKLFNADDLTSEEGLWDINVCLKYAEEFLTFVKNHTSLHEGEVFKIERPSKSARIICRKAERPSLDPLLPSWYLEDLGIKFTDE